MYRTYPCNLYQDISLSGNVPKLFYNQPTKNYIFFGEGGS